MNRGHGGSRAGAQALCLLIACIAILAGGCGDIAVTRSGGAAPPRPGHADRPKDIYDGKTFDRRTVESICEEDVIALSDPGIVIDKSSYILALHSGQQPVKEYPITLGHDPVGDKRVEGDFRTPEGTYEVRDMYPHEDWMYFIWVSYPDGEDEAEFREMKATGLIPSDATIGGEIGIHAYRDDGFMERGHNWTHGCIGMYREDLKELYRHIRVGTPVLITR